MPRIIVKADSDTGYQQRYLVYIDRRYNPPYVQVWVDKSNPLCGDHWYPVRRRSAVVRKAVRKLNRS